MPKVTAGSRELYFEARGSGDPLLLIQGLSGTHLAWGERFLEALDASLQLIIYDHRGIGRSDAAGEPFTIGDLAEDAAALLDTLELETAHIMGISMGGMVAQELALAEPGRVRSLTLGCTYAGGPGSRLTDPSVAARLMTAAMSGDRELILRTAWEANTSAAFASDAGNFEEFRLMAMSLPVPVAVQLMQLNAVSGHDTSARLSAITTPTLVLHGTKDQILDSSNGEQIGGLIPGAQLELLDGAGHLFWWERPQESAALVVEHIASAMTAG